MKSIIIFSKYDINGPSSRQRSYLYFKYFNNSKYCIIKPFFYSDYILNLYNMKFNFLKILFSYFNRVIYILTNSFKDSFVIIEKELFPYLPYWFESFFLIKFNNYSLDFDDAIFIKYESIFFLKNKHLKLAKNSKFISIGNYWYNTIFDINKTFFLPTIVETNLKFNIYKNNIKPVIVWIGTPSNLSYLNMITIVLEDLKLNNFDFIFRTIGVDYTNKNLNVENFKWDINNEYDLLKSSDIGIMPLYNNKWEKGKCGYKLLQYMNSSLPVIASSVSANNQIVIHNYNGFLASNLDEWKIYLTILLLNKDLRLKFGNNGRNHVVNNYSLKIWASKYYNKINSY